MNRSEFIKELREALKNSVNEAAVQENVRYYAGYIEDEVKKGRNEKEVIEELGDPWLIAKTIATTPGNQSASQSYDRVDEDYNYTKSSEEGKKKHGNIHVFDLSSKWKIVLLIVAIVAILFVVFSIVSGIISMLMPFLGPLLLIIIVVKIFSNRKR